MEVDKLGKQNAHREKLDGQGKMVHPRTFWDVVKTDVHNYFYFLLPIVLIHQLGWYVIFWGSIIKHAFESKMDEN